MCMLDPTFKFSQHSLSDFTECPRRFYLRYVEKQAWPLVETGPTGLSPLEYQSYLWRGTLLHRWIERYWLGITPASLDGIRSAGDGDELQVWWSRFAATGFDDLPLQRLPELALVAQVGENSLYARFDLLAIDSPEPSSFGRGGAGEIGSRRAVIVDWKTLRGGRPPRDAFLAQRFQTRIYLFVLATAGAAYNDGLPFSPGQCCMRYWLANFPAQPWVEIGYSQADYERDRQWLLDLMEDVLSREGEAQFPMAQDERRCGYCTYRTLCRRAGGHTAAPAGPQDLDEWFDIDSVAELSF